ncbi:MAG: hypothetical protein II336_05615 [Loktanella sp.]|nr:hypothetical protein [Loktanella sp.]
MRTEIIDKPYTVIIYDRQMTDGTTKRRAGTFKEIEPNIFEQVNTASDPIINGKPVMFYEYDDDEDVFTIANRHLRCVGEI